MHSKLTSLLVLTLAGLAVRVATAQNAPAAIPPASAQPAAAQTSTAPADAAVSALPAEAGIQPAAATAPARGGRGGRGGAGAAAPAGGRGAATVAQPTEEQLAALRAKVDELTLAINQLKASGAKDDLIVDAESCGWIAINTLRVPNGFVTATTYNSCLSSVNDGLRRAQQIKDGTAIWPTLTGRVQRAFRSVVDGTAQPYRLIIPASYDPAKPIPLYVYLHGRSPTDPDLGWGWTGGADRPGGAGGGNNAYIRVDVFGRGNNSFRYAGETDVFEAIASICKRYNIDQKRILLAGFSMGGAGDWQIGLRVPDMFCGLEIDAGVIGNRLNLDGLTPAQKGATVPYGITVPHALNVFNVPLVGYAGENDAQLAASTNIREQLVREGFHFDQLTNLHTVGTDINALFLVIPGVGHAHATGETLRKVDEYSAANFARGVVIPDHIRFTTYTTRYNRSFWITVDGMQQSFNRADVDATRDAAKANFTIKTNNLSRLVVTDAAAAKQVVIDSDTLAVKPAASILLVRNAAGHWQQGDPAADAGLRKQHNLQGPIDDAFFDAFLCVTPTGQPFNAIADARGKQELDRFSKMFIRDFCGEPRTKPDQAISAEDIANNNLILFGDPGSNQVLAKIAAQLPLKWTKDSIVVGDKTYTAADHVPILIYPNPLNPKRYVVINTGLMIGGSGGGLSAIYGDYAVLQVATGANGQFTSTVAADGVFDEAWQLPKP